MVDLRTCKCGDKLKTVHGTILTYVKPLPDEHYYDHEIQYPDGSRGTRIHDGHVFRIQSWYIVKKLLQLHADLFLILATGISIGHTRSHSPHPVHLPARCTP